MLRILIGFLCVFVAGSPPAWGAQMEGPTVYEVEPSLAVISDDGSQAYYVESGSYGWTDESFGPKKNSALIRLDLNQKISAKIDLDPSVGGTKFRLVGFAPTGELIGYSRGNVWAYAPATRALRVLFTAPKKQKIRWAALQTQAGPVFVSLAPGDHPETPVARHSVSRFMILLS